MMPKPLTIITVVYNGASLLEGTLQSVVAQVDQNFNYLVVDGASSDGTLDVIKRHEAHIDHWSSEPDGGLYDAMNKALGLVTSGAVWFLNAGDHLADHQTTQRVLNALINEKAEVIYGEVILVNDERKRLGTRSELTTQKLPKVLSHNSFRYGMTVCHQGFIADRTLTENYLTENLAADIDWVLNILRKQPKTVRIDEPLAEYLVGGVSKQRHQQSLKDRFRVLSKHYGAFSTFLAHGLILVRGGLHTIFRKGKERY